MEKIFYVVGVDRNQDLDLHNPVMSFLSGFFSSEHAHNIKMYAHGNNYKMVTDPLYNDLFKEFDGKMMPHVFKVEASSTFIEHFKKYFNNEEVQKRWQIKPYLEFTLDNEGSISPTKWYDDDFKKFLGL